MTDLPPIDNPGDVWAVGQRRRPDGSFPPPGGGGGIPGDDGGVHQDEVDPGGSGGSGPALHPCSSPDTALDWNADAAAAEALRRIIDAALSQDDPTHNLANREYGAMICEAAGGVLTISPIVWGDPIFDADGNWLTPGQRPTVSVDIDACGPGGSPLAMIHIHPSTGTAGAVPSWEDAQWVAAINARRGDDRGRIYVVAIDGELFRIEVFDESNVGASATGESGPEVNPDAQPCSPGSVQ